jgi:type II secretory pathway component PulK
VARRPEDKEHAHSSQDARPFGLLQRTATGYLANNHGVALVITLFVVALVAVLVLEYYFDASVELDLAANYASDAQAYSLALSGVNMARVILLRDDREVDGQKSDGPQSTWYRLGAIPICVPPQQLLALVGEASAGGALTLEKPMGFVEATTSETACVSLRIVDEQSKLPLNALVPPVTSQTGTQQGTQQQSTTGTPTPTRTGSTTNPAQGKSPNTPAPMGSSSVNSDWEPVFKQLFESLHIEEDKLAAVVDWLDQDDVPLGLGGAENTYYETLKPRYKARNGPMRTLGELRLVRGFDFETLAKLFPGSTPEAMADIDLGNNIYVTPYGTDQEAKVNVNTALPEVLHILLGGLYDGPGSVTKLVEEIVAKRQEKQFDDLKQVKDLIIDAGIQSKLERVADVKSTHFRVISTGMIGVIQKRVVAVLKRDQQETPSLVYLKVE